MSTEHAGTKDAWRQRIRAVRAARSVAAKEHDDRRIQAAVAALRDAHRTIAAYLPMRTEPGSVAMLDALRECGVEVLLPVTSGRRALTWAHYTGAEHTAPARYGLHEPTGPDLGALGIHRSDLVLVPALAVDRRGVRLGRGAGHYDRALASVGADIPRVAIVHDDEFVDVLPAEPHDIPMTHVLTPPPESGRCGEDEAGERAASPAHQRPRSTRRMDVGDPGGAYRDPCADPRARRRKVLSCRRTAPLCGRSTRGRCGDAVVTSTGIRPPGLCQEIEGRDERPTRAPVRDPLSS